MRTRMYDVKNDSCQETVNISSQRDLGVQQPNISQSAVQSLRRLEAVKQTDLELKVGPGRVKQNQLFLCYLVLFYSARLQFHSIICWKKNSFLHAGCLKISHFKLQWIQSLWDQQRWTMPSRHNMFSSAKIRTCQVQDRSFDRRTRSVGRATNSV